MVDSLFDLVRRFEPGTVFVVGGGAPWLRTHKGVRDLMPELSNVDTKIPGLWEDFKDIPVVLYDPSVGVPDELVVGGREAVLAAAVGARVAVEGALAAVRVLRDEMSEGVA